MSKIKTSTNTRNNSADIDKSVFIKNESEKELLKKLKSEWKKKNQQKKNQ